MSTDTATVRQYGHFIDGRFQDPKSGCWIETVEPYSGATWAKIAQGDAQDVDAAVHSAKSAYDGGVDGEGWGRLHPSRRAAVLRRFADAIADHADELARIEARDNGKLLAEISLQVGLLSQYFHYYAGLADKIEGRLPPIEKPNTIGLVQYEPYGVCAGITPWNSPLLLLAWKLAPALAAGNTFVAKPSEFTSVSTLRLAEIAAEAGLPPGVFNVVTGLAADVGAPLVQHPLVRRVAFTGGEAGGIAVHHACSDKLIPCTLELGGKSANVVFEDANLDAALAGAVSGIFAATGQSCMAGSRLLLQESIHDRFLGRLTEIATSVRLGDPSDPETNMGPVATPPQYRKILDYIDIAVAGGATLVTGGAAKDDAGRDKGLFVKPTILSDVTSDMRIAQEEVFGPVVSVIRFKDEEDAIRIANSTQYGLAAGIWTEDLRRGFRVSERLEAGTVWINTYRSTSYAMPFGGYRRSGIGRENGIDAIREYLQQKSVHLNLGVGSVKNPFIRR